MLMQIFMKLILTKMIDLNREIKYFKVKKINHYW